MARWTRILLVLVLGGLTSAAFGDNWDRFRGPNGSGAVDDKDVPVTFGAKENIVWKAPLSGAGNSSPVIWGKRLFLQSAAKDGKRRTLHCLDAASGKTLWEKSIPGVSVKVRGDSSLASSTPTTDGEAVYVTFWDGKEIIAAAYDFEGGKLWSKNLGPFISQHGAGASPILYKDKLILANDMDGYIELNDKDKTKKPVPVDHPALLLALNKKTGEIAWETPRVAERACYSAPFLLQQPGQAAPELVVVSSTAITGYNLDTGSSKWETKDWQKSSKTLLRTVASTALSNDGVLIACCGDGNGPRRLAVAIALPGVGKTDMPRSLWENNKDFPYVPCPLARGGHFYFVNDDGYAGCCEVRTGKRLWYERVADARFYASPLLIDGKIYAASDNGEVCVFAAEPKYRELARNDLGERIRATPAVANGRLYVRGERNLFCIGKTGSK
jgi:outer membrane protein assembly factor BamB